MKKHIITLLSLALVTTTNIAFAEYSFVDPSDFTGDAFFMPASLQGSEVAAPAESHKSITKHSLPPLKKLRLRIKKKLNERDARKNELAPVAPTEDVYAAGAETSEFASKDLKDDFDETMMPDGFEADEESINENVKKKHFWQKKSKAEKKSEDVEDKENIILDCENINYDTDHYCIIATGNVNVNFVEQGTVVKADKITYDRVNNTIKAEGNVCVIKSGHTIYGEYIFVDMNEENALIEKPITTTATIEMKAQKGYVYGDKIVQENGSLNVDKSFPIHFRTQGRGPRTYNMLNSLEEEEFLAQQQDSSPIKLKTKELTITEKGDLEIISLKKASIFKGKTRLIKIPSVKIYTNKNGDFADSNIFEIGFLRGLGMYAGPGVVFEIPGGSILKAMPVLNYNHGFGVGAVARYSSASNWTQFAYGTADSKILIRGKQDLDDHLYLQYVMNDYMREWFLGRRRAKYGASLVYQNGYSSKDFLLKGQVSKFTHRVDLGYYQDIDYDTHYRKLGGSQIGTTRARYMAMATQSLWNRKNEEKQLAASLTINGQLAASVYGTGDTQVIGRVGPMLHTQVKRWMQDIGYYHSAYEDNTPMPVFDAYRYGRSNVYLREYFKLNRYLTLAWFTSINLSNDSPNDRAFQENSFYLSIGPEDIKFNIGYDFIRQNTYFIVEVMMDAKGTSVDYERLEIKQDKKAKKKEEIAEDNDQNNFQKSDKAPVLQRAVVENVKTVEDVL